MRRTLLLVVALPSVLLASGVAGGTDEAADPGGSITIVDRVGTSDGAGPADPPGAVPGADLGPGPSSNTAGTPDDRDSTPSPTSDAAVVPLRSPEGFLIAAGGAVAGAGPRWRYTVEVEAATGLEIEEVARAIARALNDQRSWSRTRTLERVEDPASARIRLLVATPETVDRLCAKVGLRTNGIFSCWNGRFAAMNSWRWEAGATGFDDLTTYRTYLINHEFGHGLGYGHIGCPEPGAPAPVMMQQSKGLDGCAPNGWPYP